MDPTGGGGAHGFDGWVPYELGHVERPNWSRTAHKVPTDTSLEQARSGDAFPDLDKGLFYLSR